MTVNLFAGAPYAHLGFGEIAVLLTALIAWSRADGEAIAMPMPSWLPWAFLGIMAVASCSLALSYPGAFDQAGIFDQF